MVGRSFVPEGSWRSNIPKGGRRFIEEISSTPIRLNQLDHIWPVHGGIRMSPGTHLACIIGTRDVLLLTAGCSTSRGGSSSTSISTERPLDVGTVQPRWQPRGWDQRDTPLAGVSKQKLCGTSFPWSVFKERDKNDCTFQHGSETIPWGPVVHLVVCAVAEDSCFECPTSCSICLALHKYSPRKSPH